MLERVLVLENSPQMLLLVWWQLIRNEKQGEIGIPSLIGVLKYYASLWIARNLMNEQVIPLPPPFCWDNYGRVSLSPKCIGQQNMPITGLRKLARVFLSLRCMAALVQISSSPCHSASSISRPTRTGNSSLIPDWKMLFLPFAAPFDQSLLWPSTKDTATSRLIYQTRS